MVTALSLCISQKADSTSDGSGNVNGVTVYRGMDAVVLVIYCWVTNYPNILQLKPMNIYELTEFLKDENLGVA